MNLSREELAWAAGFVDGEGHFRLGLTHNRPTDKRKYANPKLSVAQCDTDVLHHLQKSLGMGNVTGPYKQPKEQWNDVYHYIEFIKRPKLKFGPIPKVPYCHPEREHGAHGLCVQCYHKVWRSERYGK